MKKKALVSLVIAILVLAVSFVPVSADYGTENQITQSTDAPSETFVRLYSKVFAHDADYQVYDRNKNCITEEFASEYYAYYEEGNFLPMWDAVAENGYSLRFPEFEGVEESPVTEPNANWVMAYSEWEYELAALDDLVSGKRVEFSYRVAGKYTTDGTRIDGYVHPPELELVMTYPGDLFTYETESSFSTTLNSTATKVNFDVTFSLTFCYPYSNVVFQTIGPYTARATGTA